MPMPPPPPPGPPPAGPPPPSMPAFAPKKGGGADNRGALLQSIRQGTKLKKSVTNDKSAPIIPGKVTSNISSNNDLGRTKFSSSNSNSQPQTNGLALGGLFAGGMPKLRQTGLRSGTAGLNAANTGSDNPRRPSPEPQRQAVSNSANVTQLTEVLRRQLSGDIRNRGPPPQPPTTRTIYPDTPDSTSSTPRFRTSPDSPLANKSTLHRPHNVPPSSLPTPPIATSAPPSTNGSASTTPTTGVRPAISHGKPNVAPKPPPQAPGGGGNKPATPPKKLVVNGRVPVSRAQSMRVPRSPPVAPNQGQFPPGTVNGKDWGTIRGIPAAFHSQENLSRPAHTRNQTLPVNLLKSTAPPPPSSSTHASTLSLTGRPSAPPPSRPPVPPPPSRTQGVKPPLSPPPPPPGSGGQGAPPPPPHRQPAPPPPPSHTRPPPAIPLNGPPPPPVRNSSMRNAPDFDSRFSNLFHPVTDFPSPARFAGFAKIYNNKNAANKQQAPLPPSSVHLGNKLWESSTC